MINEFEERAAIMEFDGGMTRWAAEQAAARTRGFRTAKEYYHAARRGGYSEPPRNPRPPMGRDAANNLPGMQRGPEKENRPVPVGDVSP